MPNADELAALEKTAFVTATDTDPQAVKDIAGALNALLADVFTLCLKTKNFHWHMTGPHSRDYHLLLDEHADQIFAITDDIAERVRKIGETTVRSIGQIARLQRVRDNNADFVDPADMLSELREDDEALVTHIRAIHSLCDDGDDVATASLLENWIDQAHRRIWFSIQNSSWLKYSVPLALVYHGPHNAGNDPFKCHASLETYGVMN